MNTLKEFAEDWIGARAVLKQQLKRLDADAASPQAGLSEDDRKAIAQRLKNAIAEYDALLKQYPNA